MTYPSPPDDWSNPQHQNPQTSPADPASHPPVYQQPPSYPMLYAPPPSQPYPTQPYPTQPYPQPYGTAPAPPKHRRLLWSSIIFAGLGVVALVTFVALAAVWAVSSNHLAIPTNATTTYGTVTSDSGPLPVVTVNANTTLLYRGTTHVFNQTNVKTSITRAQAAFADTVSGAPPTAVGSSLSFSYVGDSQNGTYVGISPSRIRAAGRIPAGVITSLIVGIPLVLVGIVLFIVWLIIRRPSRRPTYSPPPAYWPAR